MGEGTYSAHLTSPRITQRGLTCMRRHALIRVVQQWPWRLVDTQCGEVDPEQHETEIPDPDNTFEAYLQRHDLKLKNIGCLTCFKD